MKCFWKVCIFPRAFHNNSLCKIRGAKRVNYGKLENREWTKRDWGTHNVLSQSLLVRNVSAIERKTDCQQSTSSLACVAGVRRGRKEERRSREARTRDDRIPSPSRTHFDFPHFLRPATQATGSLTVWLRYAATQ